MDQQSVMLTAEAFVQRYYNLLIHKSPGFVQKFYQDSSVLHRRGNGGTMASMTTMKGIHDYFTASDFKDINVTNLHAAKSLSGKLIVGVIGLLTGKDNVRRSFTQTFFLALEGKNDFYVSDDTLMFVDALNPSSTYPVKEDAFSVPIAFNMPTKKRCSHCQVPKTIQWRTGPMGPRTLCNACGFRYQYERDLPGYRPGAGLTFVPDVFYG